MFFPMLRGSIAMLCFFCQPSSSFDFSLNYEQGVTVLISHDLPEILRFSVHLSSGLSMVSCVTFYIATIQKLPGFQWWLPLVSRLLAYIVAHLSYVTFVSSIMTSENALHFSGHCFGVSYSAFHFLCDVPLLIYH